MTYLAITQGTSDWLIGKSGVLYSLHDLLIYGLDDLKALADLEFVEGPIRMAYAADAEIIALWNADYVSGTGDESWGFIRTSGSLALDARTDISHEVLERSLYVVNQRLQGLMIEGAFIHRAHPNGAHTCLAGRGTVARQVSIGYFENHVDTQLGPAHSIVSIGPAFDFKDLARGAESAGKHLQALVSAANSLLDPNRTRQVAPDTLLSQLRERLTPFRKVESGTEYANVEVLVGKSAIEKKDVYQALSLTYKDWLAVGSPLTAMQRRIIESNAVNRHPLRIVGPGGSGKTLLLQLLALQLLFEARREKRPVRILYIAHNSAMAEKVSRRFEILEGDKEQFEDDLRELQVTTLAEYGLTNLNLSFTDVIDRDAEEAKAFQLEQVVLALTSAMGELATKVAQSTIFSTVQAHEELMPILALLVSAEISISIKGHGLGGDKRRYVHSERHLSRFHGALGESDREIVFNTFEKYHRAVFEELEILDSDDIALSLLGKLRTPIWELQRRKLGFDYVFVDETQLFNENERRVFPLLTNGTKQHVPIVLALDEAQDTYAQSSAGLATLGMPDIASENLGSIHRSTRAIVRLAFFVIQRSTDLFGPDFPDFSSIAESLEEDSHPLASPPRIEVEGEDSKNIGRFVLKKIRELRKGNLRQIAVICHADGYWDSILSELRVSDLPLQVLTQRGARFPVDQPIVVLSKPPFVGGQEFDAVILVGLERGVVPPKIPDNDTLSAAVEQQSLREIYLSVTRARFRVIIALSSGATATAILQDAASAGLLVSR